MNTAQLKTFAQTSRKLLIQGVTQKLEYWGFDAKGNVTEEPSEVPGGYFFRDQVVDDVSVMPKWRSLKKAIGQRGVKDVIEQAAYTWFNRMMAIRILAKNGYDISQLEYGDGSAEPMILTRARRAQYNFLSETEKNRLQPLLTDYTKDVEAFGILLTGYCHHHILLYQVFGGLDDYTELLLPDNILNESGFVHFLNTSKAISDDDYQQVELIGWLYQFYISDRKDEVFAAFKKNKKAEAEDIPAATQIFTPKWIVKYMVQNTVGKLWLDLKPESDVKDGLKYLVANESAQAEAIISEAADIKLLDPACGSGHILVEGFDLLYACFMEEYYTPQEAVETILSRCLYGLDIDLRAKQLACFALLLKAAKQYPDILKNPILPQIYAMPEADVFSRQEVLDFLGEGNDKYEPMLSEALKLMREAKNLGSIMIFKLSAAARKAIQQRLTDLSELSALDMNLQMLMPRLTPYLQVLLTLTQQYEAVVANPPYMGQKNMNASLKEYVNKSYKISKSDLFAVFMEVCLHLNRQAGLMGMINQHSWMFLSSYEKLRDELIGKYKLQNMLHLGPRTFEELSGEVVQSTAFVFENTNPTALATHPSGTYYRLVDYRNNKEKEQSFLDGLNQHTNIPQTNFSKIPGSPIAYWVSLNTLIAFESNLGLSSYLTAKKGIATGDNDRFLRLWFEIEFSKIGFQKSQNSSGRKWHVITKGGSYRKWYGNHDYVVNWENDGYEIRNFKDSNGKLRSRPQNTNFFFKPGITWSDISSSGTGFRLLPEGFTIEGRGPGGYPYQIGNLKVLLGLLNTKISEQFLAIINPTLSINVLEISKIPIAKKSLNINESVVSNNIILTQRDWDSQETSWDFEKSPLLNQNKSLIQSYQSWKNQVTQDFFQLHQNEEELNRIFIGIYGLEEELDPYVPLKDITILQGELDRKQLEKDEEALREQGIGIRAKDLGLPLVPQDYSLPILKDEIMAQFISYTIGCWMGRYRLDKPGLHIAHPEETEEETAPYTFAGQDGTTHTFKMAPSGIIPLMGSDCSFTDDAHELVEQFIHYLWGEAAYTENINFLQECLDMELEKYLVKHFWKDHCSRYKKKPIYWLFSSPNGAFQVLVYMQRMNRFTVEKIRSEYLIPHMKHLQNQVDLTKDNPKENERLQKALIECEEYDLLLKDKADQQIEFDLDDGVDENYKLFEGVVAKVK